jgi:hypothetical protein
MTARLEKLAKQVAGLTAKVANMPWPQEMDTTINRAVVSGMRALTRPRNYTRLVLAKRERERERERELVLL